MISLFLASVKKSHLTVGTFTDFNLYIERWYGKKAYIMVTIIIPPLDRLSDFILKKIYKCRLDYRL